MAMEGLAIGGIAGPLIGGLVGMGMSEGEANAAAAAMEQANQIAMSIGAGPDLAAPIAIKLLQSQGQLTPQMEQAINVQATQLKAEDPELRNQQMMALQGLGERARLGVTPEERANLNRILSQQSSAAENQRRSMLQNLQQRGIGGGGSEIMANLAGQDAARRSAFEQSQGLAGEASSRALQAMLGGGQLAGEIRGQEFGQAQSEAARNDLTNRFNISAQRENQQRNIMAQNQAQAANLAQAQALHNQNVGALNQELYRQRNAQQQMYQNQLNRAQMQMGALQGIAQQHQQRAGNIQAGFGQMGAGVGYGLMGAYQYSQPYYQTSKADRLNNVDEDQYQQEDWYKQLNKPRPVYG